MAFPCVIRLTMFKWYSPFFSFLLPFFHFLCVWVLNGPTSSLHCVLICTPAAHSGLFGVTLCSLSLLIHPLLTDSNLSSPSPHRTKGNSHTSCSFTPYVFAFWYGKQLHKHSWFGVLIFSWNWFLLHLVFMSYSIVTQFLKRRDSVALPYSAVRNDMVIDDTHTFLHFLFLHCWV